MRLSISPLSAIVGALLSLPLGPVLSAATPGIVKRNSILDPAYYKNTTTSRGITYNYYISPPASNDKRFLILLHGWPGLSYDYRFQVDFFREAGYGVIVPDMLGYGQTDKPTDPEVYKSSLISRDIVDILDAESVGNNVVVVGHDWRVKSFILNPRVRTQRLLLITRSAKIAARAANYFPDRFSAFGFLAVGNLAASFFDAPPGMVNNLTKSVLGYELFGYWDFFARPGAHKMVEDHLESAWATDDRKSAGTVWTPEEEAHYLQAYRAPGAVEASLAWYKVVVSDIEAQDSQSIRPENVIVKKPVFFGDALKDFVTNAPAQIKSTLDCSPNSTIKLYDAGHWVQWEARDEVNRDLLAWIEGLE